MSDEIVEQTECQKENPWWADFPVDLLDGDPWPEISAQEMRKDMELAADEMLRRARTQAIKVNHELLPKILSVPDEHLKTPFRAFIHEIIKLKEAVERDRTDRTFGAEACNSN